ncbi:MAG TPA: UDP-2,3-diacylglucosamine diphosphatase [Salinivirgaceae bacterium]|nr:UDP-2,3-diacylglucosamine diphosphatase [Salinivirgaceae bacterium]
MEKKIYFASDVHLGFPNYREGRTRELRFAAWLDSIENDVEELYLLGDIFDFWFEYKKVVPRGFTRIIGRLASLSDRGIPIHFFVGNHDLWLTDYLLTEVGVIIHREPYEIIRNGRSFYLAHGDGLGSGDHGYKLLKKIFTNRTLRWLYAGLHPNFALKLAHLWSKNSRYSKGLIAEEFNPYSDILFNYAKDLEKKQHHDYYIFGHRHRPLDLQIPESGAHFINLGDWLTHFTYASFNGEKLTLHKFEI